MQTELPSFEDRDVQAAVARFSGKVTERVGAMHDGEFAILIAKVRVNKIQHADFKPKTGANSPSLYSRIHDMGVTKSVIITEAEGGRLLEEALTMADEKFGISNLFAGIEKGTGEVTDIEAHNEAIEIVDDEGIEGLIGERPDDADPGEVIDVLDDLTGLDGDE